MESKDVAIVLEGDPRVYYINRGLERGLSLDQLTQQIQGNQVTLHVIEMRLWSPLNPSGRGGRSLASPVVSSIAHRFLVFIALGNDLNLYTSSTIALPYQNNFYS